MNRVVWVYNAKEEDIRGLIKSVGNTIGSVHFLKRTDGSLRKMSYRLHVVEPSFVAGPKGGNSGGYISVGKKRVNRKEVNIKNKQVTVFDCNKVIKGEDGKVIGRGAYRTVPLENVVQITAKGVKYIIKRDSGPRGL